MPIISKVLPQRPKLPLKHPDLQFHVGLSLESLQRFYRFLFPLFFVPYLHRLNL